MLKDKIKITDIGNENPFRVPDGYFDVLEHQIMSRIEEHSNKPKGIIFYLKPAIAIASSFALIFLLIYPIKTINNKVAKNKAKTEDLMADYLLNYFNSDTEIIEGLEKTVSKKSFSDYEIETVLLASMSDIDLFELN